MDRNDDDDVCWSLEHIKRYRQAFLAVVLSIPSYCVLLLWLLLSWCSFFLARNSALHRLLLSRLKAKVDSSAFSSLSLVILLLYSIFASIFGHFVLNSFFACGFKFSHLISFYRIRNIHIYFFFPQNYQFTWGMYTSTLDWMVYIVYQWIRDQIAWLKCFAHFLYTMFVTWIVHFSPNGM